MKSRLCKLLFSASLIFTLCGSAQAAVVFSNGFESPTVPVGGFFIYAPGATFGPWTAVGIAASSVISGSFTQSGITFLAQEGNQWADLAGSNSNSTEGFGTSISTVVGQFYDVSFWVGNVINPGGFFGISTTVNAFVNGLPAFTAVNTSGNGTTQTWQHYNFQTLATSATTTFSFINADPFSDYLSGLDNVQIIEIAAVPEPSTWAMLILGFAGVGFMAYRRSRKDQGLALAAV
jgi:hypothetical protein